MSQLMENVIDDKLIDTLSTNNLDENSEKNIEFNLDKYKISIKEIVSATIISICMLFGIKGFIIGFILWNILKGKSRFIYKTGRNIINYSIGYLMVLMFIGLIVWVLFGNSFVRGIIMFFKFFILIGIYKCIRGKIYVYPLNIKIFN